MKYLLLGAGLQGSAIAHDLLRHAPQTEKLTIVDHNGELLANLLDRLADPRVEGIVCDVTQNEKLAPLMERVSTVISAVHYWYNFQLSAQAVACRAHFLDLGGNNDIVAKELKLHDRASERGTTIIPDCGLAPGMASILAYHLHGTFDEVENLRIRVGGLPQKPQPPLDYQLLFAVQGLINEYIEPCVVIRNGKIETLAGLTELETVHFPAPFGELEAFQTSGGISTLPVTLQGKVQNLDYKTIRFKGHCEKFRLLMELGLTSSEPVCFQDKEIAPRDFLGMMLEKRLGFAIEDVALVLIEAEGYSGGSRVRRSIRVIDYYDSANGISAMARMTGYPAAIVAWMLAAGEIVKPGAHPQELAVPAQLFMSELNRRGIQLRWSEKILI